MLVTNDFDVRQPAFDDDHLNDAIDNFLIRDNSTGVNVAMFYVMAGQFNAKIFQFAAGNNAISERLDDLTEVVIAENSIAGKTNFFNEDFGTIGSFYFLRGRFFLFGNLDGGFRKRACFWKLGEEIAWSGCAASGCISRCSRSCRLRV